MALTLRQAIIEKKSKDFRRALQEGLEKLDNFFNQEIEKAPSLLEKLFLEKEKIISKIKLLSEAEEEWNAFVMKVFNSDIEDLIDFEE